ncbi:MAG: type IV pilin-like G/H family protein [Leptolyngbya sp. BL-A-14]
MRQEEGFTLLEITIVLVISGILAAIALPSFLNQASKAKQVEAAMYLGTLNRAQQGYMLEHARFAESASTLGVVIQNSPNYSYSIHLDGAGNQFAIHDAKALSPSLRPYVGMAAITQGGTNDAKVETALCRAKTAQLGQAEQPILADTAVTCATSTEPVGQ